MLGVSSYAKHLEYFQEQYIKTPGEGNHNYSSPKHYIMTNHDLQE
jgi:hypothetical protein